MVLGRLLSSSLALLTLALLTTGLLTLLGPATLAAQAPEVLADASGASLTERPLVRVHERVIYPDGVGDVLAHVYRDGLIVLFNTTPDGLLSVFRANPEFIVEPIQTLLAEAQIATQGGRCDVAEGIGTEIDLAPGATGRSATFSWFGLRDNRSNHLLIGDSTVADNFGTPCSQELTDALLAVQGSILQTFKPGNVSPPITLRADDQVLYVVRNSLQEDIDCGDASLVDDSFVFRDGLVVRDGYTSNGELILERGQATPMARHSFSQALTRNRVGFQAGECKASFFQPFSVDGACIDYSFQTGATWYGQGQRRATLFATDGTEASCTFAQAEIAGAVTEFLRNTSAQPQTQRVSGHLPTL